MPPLPTLPRGPCRVRSVPKRLQAPCPSIGARQTIELVFGPVSVRQVCRAEPNSLRYAAFKQGARSQFLMALRAARQSLRSSPGQDGERRNPIRLAAHRLVRKAVLDDSFFYVLRTLGFRMIETAGLFVFDGGNDAIDE